MVNRLLTKLKATARDQLTYTYRFSLGVFWVASVSSAGDCEPLQPWDRTRGTVKASALFFIMAVCRFMTSWMCWKIVWRLRTVPSPLLLSKSSSSWHSTCLQRISKSSTELESHWDWLSLVSKRVSLTPSWVTFSFSHSVHPSCLHRSLSLHWHLEWDLWF